MLQTALVIDPSSIRPYSPDVTVLPGIAVVEGGKLIARIDVYDGPSVWSDYPNLDWTRAGYWSTGGAWDYFEGGDARVRGVFLVGYETPVGAVPIAGTATFTGNATGLWYVPRGGVSSGSIPCACDELPVFGTASFTANFGARTVAGSLTNMRAGIEDYQGGCCGIWNDVGFTSTISGNAIEGTTWAINSPPDAMGPGATGTLRGRFFGPNAREVGAVWTLFDGATAVMGTITGRQP